MERAHPARSLQVNGTPRTFLLAAHMDKQPMLLVATCGTSLEAPELHRQRTIFDEDAHESFIWRATGKQPMVHAKYRSTFNSVDLFNRYLSSSLQYSTRSPWVRLMISSFGIVITNAFLAFKHWHNLDSRDLPFNVYKRRLADECIEALRVERGSNVRMSRGGSDGAGSRGSGSGRSGRGSGSTAVAAESAGPVDTGQAVGDKRGAWDPTEMPLCLKGHTLMCNSGRQPNCDMCKKPTHTFCECGVALCNPVGKGGKHGPSCAVGHFVQVLASTNGAAKQYKPRGNAVQKS